MSHRTGTAYSQPAEKPAAAFWRDSTIATSEIHNQHVLLDQDMMDALACLSWSEVMILLPIAAATHLNCGTGYYGKLWHTPMECYDTVPWQWYQVATYLTTTLRVMVSGHYTKHPSAFLFVVQI